MSILSLQFNMKTASIGVIASFTVLSFMSRALCDDRRSVCEVGWREVGLVLTAHTCTTRYLDDEHLTI